jgi:CubicO group peptidase (beta-lactamase class C family)
MVKNLLVLLALLVSVNLSAQEESRTTEQFVREIDKKIPQLLHDFTVPGAAIAIIENGEIVLQKGYGFSDLEKEVKVNTETGFNIGSISKTIAAWGVMKLVHEGKVDLDAPAETYLTRWHLPESEYDSDKVTIRRLLSHTAGLSLHGYPGWSPSDALPTLEESLNGKNNGPGRVEIIMEPGTKYQYSGGGFTILQLIVEEVTGQKFEDYMQAQILDPLGMTNSSYKIDDKIMAASSLEYNNYGEEIDFESFTAQAAAGLHVTIGDFTRFAFANLYRNKDHEKYNPVLPTDVIQQMMKPVPEAQGRFGYGMGYMIESIPGTSVLLAGHRGSNTGWQAIFNVNPETNDGFIMVTNGGSGQNIYHPIFYDWALWKMGVSLEDWYNAKPPISKKLKSIVDSKGIDDIATSYTELKKNQPDKYDFSEVQLNELGYYYMGKDDLEKAIAIFKLNVEVFPYAFNVYDSYGEALLAQGAREEAVENYKKSVSLNPGNENGIQVLNDLGESTEDLLFKVPIEHLKHLEGEYLATHDEDWRIIVEVNRGVLKCVDKFYEFTLVPIGDDKFVNPRFGALWRFDTNDKNAKPMMLFGEYKFKKLK